MFLEIKMLPSSISGYLPHVGLLLIFMGIIFAIVAAVDMPSQTKANDAAAAGKFTVLSYSFIVAGGFILIGPFH